MTISKEKMNMIKQYYCIKDESGKTKIYKGSNVMAKVISVASYNMLIDVFGIECKAKMKDISKQYINLSEKYREGDTIIVNVTEVNYPEGEVSIDNPDYIKRISIKCAEAFSVN